MKTTIYSGLAALLGLVGLANAGSIPSGHVTGVYCGYYGNANMCSVYFDVKVAGNQPACVPTSPALNEQNHRFQFRLDDIGKGLLAIALSANSTGALVQADGTGACSIWGDTESLNTLFILPTGYPAFTQ